MTRTRRRLLIAGSSLVTVAVLAVSTGAAQACTQWLRGTDAPARVDLAAESARSLDTRRLSPEQLAGARRDGVLLVTDGADLGRVAGRFTLAAAPGSSAGGTMVFALRGPSSLKLADGRAPYAVRVDPARMGLKDGTYTVTARRDGRSAPQATARLVVTRGGAQASGSAAPTVTAPTPATGTQAPAPTSSAPMSSAPGASTGGSGTTSTTTTTSTPPAPKPTATRPTTTTTTDAPPPAPKPTASTTRTTTTRPTTTTSTTSAAPAPAPATGEAGEVVRLTNEQRTANGCPALKVSAALTRSSQGHSENMARQDNMAHELDGRSPFDRMTAAGYSYRMAAENIAAGQHTPQDVVTGWMNSPGHRANILNCSLTEIGVGVARNDASRYKIYWTQNFGTPR